MLLKIPSPWAERAAANFRWSRFAPTPAAAALCFAIVVVSSAALLDRASFFQTAARNQLCATIFVPTLTGALRQSATLVTHVFLHVDWSHLAGNAAFLLILASGASRRILAESGGTKPLRAVAALSAFFLASGVAGGLVFVLTDRIAPSCTIGASGAIAGLLGAALRYAFRGEAEERSDPRGIDALSRGVAAAITAIVLTNAALSAVGAALRIAPFVTAWQSHAGGLIFGAITFPWFARLAR